MKAKLTPGQRKLKAYAGEIVAKTVRLRNKASLVAGDPAWGRNLTALRNTAQDMFDLLAEIIEGRCRVCGCTSIDCGQCVEKTGEPCTWAGPELCSACKEDPR